MRKPFGIIAISLLFLVFFPKQVFSESSYVLPYPPQMPGSLMYKLRLIFEDIQGYWYFGNFGKFSYSLKQSDKYLVQAKTLFEYKQFLLGDDALKTSDMYFKKSPIYLAKAKEENKNTDRQKKILKEASWRHIEVLNEIKTHVPKEIIWNPEKSQPTKIFLSDNLTKAIRIRESCI